MDPHSPYNLGFENAHLFLDNRDAPFEEKEVSDILNDYLNRSKNGFPKSKLNSLVALYDAEINYLDNNLGVLFSRFDELGFLNNSIIIITSDHGEEFLEHGGYNHRKTCYIEQIHVPLIVYYPSVLEPKEVTSVVENMDIFSTILDLVEIDLPVSAAAVQSQSLVPLMAGNEQSSMDFYGISLYSDVNQSRNH